MENICVSIRIRPLSQAELPDGSPWLVQGNRMILQDASRGAVPDCEFDYIFSGDVATSLIFDSRTRDIIRSAVDGFNGTVFAYGQTSSGKTFTMKGNEQEPGIIPLSIQEVFNCIAQAEGREFLLRVSYLEIYNEEINDLLVPDNRRLQVHESVERGVYVAGLREEIVTCPEQVLEILHVGEANRAIGETRMNEKSSRSHTIFRMVIESRELSQDPEAAEGTDAVLVSALTLVDLAGSERVSKTGAEGNRLKEGAHINKSLLTLGTVINKLSEGADRNGGHIPFRDSKLTRILQPALGGNTKTAVICCVTPALRHEDETAGTLRFAARAKRVTNCAQVNEILTNAALMRRQKKEIEELRRQLEDAHSPELEGQILKLRNELLQMESERERMALQLAEERAAQAERERRLEEQARKIESLKTMVINSAVDDREEKRSKKFNRRETWCPPRLAPISPAAKRHRGPEGPSSSSVSETAAFNTGSSAPPPPLPTLMPHSNHVGGQRGGGSRIARGKTISEEVAEEDEISADVGVERGGQGIGVEGGKLMEKIEEEEEEEGGEEAETSKGMQWEQQGQQGGLPLRDVAAQLLEKDQEIQRLRSQLAATAAVNFSHPQKTPTTSGSDPAAGHHLASRADLSSAAGAGDDDEENNSSSGEQRRAKSMGSDVALLKDLQTQVAKLQSEKAFLRADLEFVEQQAKEQVKAARAKAAELEASLAACRREEGQRQVESNSRGTAQAHEVEEMKKLREEVQRKEEERRQMSERLQEVGQEKRKAEEEMKRMRREMEVMKQQREKETRGIKMTEASEMTEAASRSQELSAELQELRREKEEREEALTQARGEKEAMEVEMRGKEEEVEQMRREREEKEGEMKQLRETNGALGLKIEDARLSMEEMRRMLAEERVVWEGRVSAAEERAAAAEGESAEVREALMRKEKEIGDLLRRMGEVSKQREELEELLRESRGREAREGERSRGLEVEMVRVKGEMKQMQQEKEQSEEAARAAQEEASKKEGRVADLETKMAAAAAEKADLSAKLQQIEAQLSLEKQNAAAAITRMEALKQQQKDEVALLRNELASCRKELAAAKTRPAALEKERDSLLKERDKSRTKLTEVENKLKSALQDKLTIQVEKANLEREAKMLRGQSSILSRDLKKKEEEVGRRRETMAQAAKADRQLAVMSGELEEKTAALGTAQALVMELQSSLQQQAAEMQRQQQKMAEVTAAKEAVESEKDEMMQRAEAAFAAMGLQLEEREREMAAMRNEVDKQLLELQLRDEQMEGLRKECEVEVERMRQGSESMLAEFESERSKMRAAGEQLKQQMAAALASAAEREGKVEAAEERSRGLEQRLSRMQREIEAAAVVAADLRTVQQQLADLEKQREELEAAAEEERKEREAVERELEGMREEVMRLERQAMRRIVEEEERAEAVEKQLKEMAAELESERQQMRQVRGEKEEAVSGMRRSEQRVSGLEKEWKDAVQKAAEVQRGASAMQRLVDGQQQQMHRLELEKQQLERRVAELKASVERLEMAEEERRDRAGTWQDGGEVERMKDESIWLQRTISELKDTIANSKMEKEAKDAKREADIARLKDRLRLSEQQREENESLLRSLTSSSSSGQEAKGSSKAGDGRLRLAVEKMLRAQEKGRALLRELETVRKQLKEKSEKFDELDTLVREDDLGSQVIKWKEKAAELQQQLAAVAVGAGAGGMGSMKRAADGGHEINSAHKETADNTATDGKKSPHVEGRDSKASEEMKLAELNVDHVCNVASAMEVDKKSNSEGAENSATTARGMKPPLKRSTRRAALQAVDDADKENVSML